MEGDTWQRLAWWWNGSHAQTDDYGYTLRRDVWLEQHRDTGVFRVRWRGGQWTARDGVRWSPRAAVIDEALDRLLGPDKSRWQKTMYFDEAADA